MSAEKSANVSQQGSEGSGQGHEESEADRESTSSRQRNLSGL